MKEHTKKCEFHLWRTQWVNIGHRRGGKVRICCSDLRCHVERTVTKAEAEELCGAPPPAAVPPSELARRIGA